MMWLGCQYRLTGSGKVVMTLDPDRVNAAKRKYYRLVQKAKRGEISREKVDLAFFPLDPRQGSMFEAGANFFILSVKPRLLIPMHFWGRAEIAVEFARRARCRETEVLAMTRRQCELLEDNFRRRAESLYHELLLLLSGGGTVE